MFKSFLSIPAVAFLFTTNPIQAAEPTDAHAELLKERAAVDASYKEAVASQAGVVESAQKAVAAFRTCKNPRFQLRANATLQRAEAARRVFETSRRGTQAFRRELERRRASLESERRALLRQYRGKMRDAAYSAGEQSYAVGMKERYLKPLETVLVQQIKDYGAGITTYSQVLEKYAELCARPGYTDAAGVEFVKELDLSVSTLTTESEKLANAVAGSRAPPEKAAAMK